MQHIALHGAAAWRRRDVLWSSATARCTPFHFERSLKVARITLALFRYKWILILQFRPNRHQRNARHKHFQTSREGLDMEGGLRSHPIWQKSIYQIIYCIRLFTVSDYLLFNYIYKLVYSYIRCCPWQSLVKSAFGGGEENKQIIFFY